MPGLCYSNELISRDEGLHADFACLIYSMLQGRLSDSVAHDIVAGAVEAERKFICTSAVSLGRFEWRFERSTQRNRRKNGISIGSRATELFPR